MRTANEGSCSCLLGADAVNEQASLPFTYEFEGGYGFLNPWIVRVGVVVEHHDGALAEHRTPGFDLTYGVIPSVGAIDVQQLD